MPPVLKIRLGGAGRCSKPGGRCRGVQDTGVRSLKYLYDLGDGWEHTVRIERIAHAVPGITYPRLIQTTGRCPPEDVGGPCGYRDFAALADPDHEQHAETLTRVAEPFDPATADAESHARAVAALAKRWARSPSTGRKRSN